MKGRWVKGYQADNVKGTYSEKGTGRPPCVHSTKNPYPAKPGAAPAKMAGVPKKRVKQAEG